jgi:hypothetical protein
MVVTKNKDEVDSDSEADEESDEATEKELKKKALQCKYYCTCMSSFSVFLFFLIPFILISFSHFLYIMFSISWLR